jgi:cysteinyl-tRNA synthetase
VKLYNTLTRKIEEFRPIEDEKVGVIPVGRLFIGTTYWAYVCLCPGYFARFLRQTDKVNWVMNITDVEHMMNDEDTGEDKMERCKRGKSVWEIADKYVALNDI